MGERLFELKSNKGSPKWMRAAENKPLLLFMCDALFYKLMQYPCNMALMISVIGIYLCGSCQLFRSLLS